MRARIVGGLIALVFLGAVAGILLTRSNDRSEVRPATDGSEAHPRWSRAAPLPVPRIEAAGTVIDGRLLVVSGFMDSLLTSTTRVDLYDPTTDEWRRLSDIPQALTHANLAVDGTRVWLAGGFEGDHPGPVTSRVWTYDLETSTWSERPPLPEPRGAGALVIAGRQLHYFGGFAADRETNEADHWVLDLESPSAWRTAAPLPAARGQLGAVTIRGKIYAVGGQFFHDERAPVDLDLVHVYDPTTDVWRRLTGLPIAVSHAEASTFAYRDRIFVVGGRSNVGLRPVLDEIFLYDPGTDQWIGLPPLPRGLLGPVSNVLDGKLFVAGGSARNWHTPQSRTFHRRLHDVWESGPPIPIEMADVAAGIIGKKLYLVGGPWRPATLAYDLSRREWTSRHALTKRPFPGGHHAAEVWSSRLYLFGGSERAIGRTQVYDPSVDAWTVGRDMPFAAGSSASAAIGGKIYVTGGIVDEQITDRAAVYDPVRDEWSEIAPMPAARSHASAGTDGRMLYLFGGRGPGSGDTRGAHSYADTQVYDPETNTWASSAEPDSRLEPLPVARSGMGKAVYAKGRFFVFGGKPEDGSGANEHGVYARVDIYDPQTNRWELGASMPTPRHGIFPVVIADRVYVAGGALVAGGSASRILEVYNLP